MAVQAAANGSAIDAVALFASPAAFQFSTLAPDPDALIARFRNTGLLRDPAFPRDREAWLAEFDEVAPEAVVGRIAPRPFLIVHGDADDVVPYHHAERIFARAGEPKELVRLPAGGHQLRRDARAVDALVDWLERTFAPVRP